MLNTSVNYLLQNHCTMLKTNMSYNLQTNFLWHKLFKANIYLCIMVTKQIMDVYFFFVLIYICSLIKNWDGNVF